MKMLDVTNHRPWPLPDGRPLMAQTWHNLLFAHWPVPQSLLRHKVPPGVEIDTFDGQAWLGIVAFRLSNIRLRNAPAVGLVSSFPEVNVRTYVTRNGKPGVYFLSLDTDNPLAIALARPWFRLNYHLAKIRFDVEGSRVSFSSKRTGRKTPSVGFDVNYSPSGHSIDPGPRSLERWLTERYCYYAGGRDAAYLCEIHHPPWRLYPADATITQNTLAQAHGIDLPDRGPLLHYAHYMKAVIWPVQKVRLQARPFELPRCATESSTLAG